MPDVLETEVFAAWLRSLRDVRAKATIAARIQRLKFGNPGDVRSAGGGVSEMRIHHGPGYRVYYVRRGNDLIILLCGGDKSTQEKDIETAGKLAEELD